MSLFIGTLAFEDQGLSYQLSVKIGVLMGSIASALLGGWLLSRANQTHTSQGEKPYAK